MRRFVLVGVFALSTMVVAPAFAANTVTTSSNSSVGSGAISAVTGNGQASASTSAMNQSYGSATQTNLSGSAGFGGPVSWNLAGNYNTSGSTSGSQGTTTQTGTSSKSGGGSTSGSLFGSFQTGSGSAATSH